MIKTKLVHLLFFIFAFALGMQGQVTIGKAEKPVAGALLDLKNLDTPGASGSNANRGLMLPRVTLSDIQKLYPMLSTGYDPSENDKHNGLVVYNMSNVGLDFCPGIYVWNANKWSRIPDGCFKNGFDTQSLLFYKSALVAKNINLVSGRDNIFVQWLDDANIPWQTNGFPVSGTRAITKTFAFHPTVNNSGADRVSTATATLRSGSDTQTELIVITQLNREMKFDHPTTAYPALGAEHSLTIDSEADWAANLSATNPGTMITNLTGNSQAAGDGKIMKVTLDNNNTWAERTATLDVTSTDPDFLTRTMDVKQAKADPLLNITLPTPDASGNALVELAGTTALVPFNVGFDVNSDYTITQDNTAYPLNVDWSQVFVGPNPNGSVQTGGVPANTVGKTLTYSVEPTSIDLAAGTVLQTNLVLQSANTSPATPVSRNMLVKHTVPARMDDLAASPTWGSEHIMPSGKTIKLTAKTNSQWTAKWMLDATSATGGEVSIPASNYSAEELNIALPEYRKWEPMRYVSVMHSLDGTNFTRASHYEQYGYDLNLYFYDTPGNNGNTETVIPQAGNIYSFAFSTISEAPLFTLAVTDGNNNGAWLTSKENIDVNTPGKTVLASVTVPANNTWYDRGVGFHYMKREYGNPAFPTDPDGWHNPTNHVQRGYSLDATWQDTPGHGGNVGTEIPRGGSPYTFQFRTTSYAPPFTLAATDGNNAGAWLDSKSNINVNTSNGYTTASVTIPPNNSWAARWVGFHFNKPGWNQAPNADSWFHPPGAVQQGYQLWLAGDHGNLIGATVPSEGGQDQWGNPRYYLNTHSSVGCPNFQIAFFSGITPGTHGQPAGDWIWNSEYTNVGHHPVIVPDNGSGADRNVYVFLQTPGRKDEHGNPIEWVCVGHYFQPKPIAKAVGGLLVHNTALTAYLRDTRGAAGIAALNNLCATYIGAEWSSLWRFRTTDDGNSGLVVLDDSQSHLYQYLNPIGLSVFEGETSYAGYYNTTSFGTTTIVSSIGDNYVSYGATSIATHNQFGNYDNAIVTFRCAKLR